MSELLTVLLPDIGDFQSVEVIELIALENAAVQNETSTLLTLESDKASIDIPSPYSGTLTRWLVKPGDKVSEGTPIAVIEVSLNALPNAPSSTASTTAPSNPALADATSTEPDYDVVVIGAGPGGYSAAFRAADLGLKVALIERYAALGGVCLNVGCIPSKALLHVAAVMEECKEFANIGVRYAPPELDLPTLRQHKDDVVNKLTGGIAAMAKLRNVDVIQGLARFSSSHTLNIGQQDQEQSLRFKYCIVAVGSSSVKLPFMPDDPRIIDSTGALNLEDIPEKMLVVGGGIIGLEMASVYSSLGSKIDIVEMADSLMPGADADLVKVWRRFNEKHFDNIMLSTKTTAASVDKDGVFVRFENTKGQSSETRYDKVLVAVGRRPNGGSINAEAAGLAVDQRGFIDVDQQLRTAVPHIFAIGDVIGQPMLAHKAVHESHVAAEVIAGEINNDAKLKSASFDPMQIPSVAYTNPEVAWAGKTETQLKAEGIAFTKAVFPWSASGRAIANGRSEGHSKLLFAKDSGRIIGGAIVGINAGDMVSEICLAIEMGADAIDMAKTIHPHPTLGESIGLAAEVALGSCTDLPPPRKPRG